MNRMSRIALVLMLVAANAGCQNCLARFRGARCRSGLSLPSLRMPRARSQAPAPCNNGCNQPGFATEQAVPNGYLGGAPYSAGPMIETGPINGGISANRPYYNNEVYSQNRPIVTDSVVSGGYVSGGIVPGSVVSGATVTGGNIMAVPGPESAPMPLNN